MVFVFFDIFFIFNVLGTGLKGRLTNQFFFFNKYTTLIFKISFFWITFKPFFLVKKS
jgi:hypothetical protein